MYAKYALERDFHDISGIWSHGGIRRGIYEKYFCINRTQNLAWPMPTQTSILSLGGDPKLIFPDTVYDFAAYKEPWWDFLNVHDKEETHYTKLKFSTTGIFQRNQQCD